MQAPGVVGNADYITGPSGEVSPNELKGGEFVKYDGSGNIVRAVAGDAVLGITSRDERKGQVTVFVGLSNPLVLMDQATAGEITAEEDVYVASSTTVQDSAGATTGHKAIGKCVETVEGGKKALVLFLSTLRQFGADAP